MLAERIVSLSWRLKRAEHFQNAVIDALIEHGLHGASSGFGWTSENRDRATKEAAAGDVDVMLGIVINHDFANSKTLDMLLSYERRIESSLYRAIAELKKMRNVRKEQDEDVARACMHGQDAHATFLETALEINDCTNEANFENEGCHPQAQLGNGLDSACHPHPEKGVQDEAVTHICTNEANLEETCSGLVPARE